MTVKELIEKLKELPEKNEIKMSSTHDGKEIIDDVGYCFLSYKKDYVWILSK